MSDSMQDIISDVRHSADVDQYTKEQRQFLWSVAERLEAARAQGGEAVAYEYWWKDSPRIKSVDKAERVPVGAEELRACLSIAAQILKDQGAGGSIMGRFNKALGESKGDGNEQH